MKELNPLEIKEVSGGWFIIALRFAIPTIINMVGYAINKKHRHEEITPQGLAIAGGSAIIGAGVAVGGGLAAGGTVIGNAVWAPNGMAISAAGNAISKNY